MPSWRWQVSRRIPRGDPPSLFQIAEHHGVIEDAVCLYYSPENPNFPRLFAFNTPEEIRANRDERLREARTASSLTLLAAIEASFRLDYRQRKSSRKRDDLSRAFHTLYKQKENTEFPSRTRSCKDGSTTPTWRPLWSVTSGTLSSIDTGSPMDAIGLPSSVVNTTSRRSMTSVAE